jgi:hypothetical protein
MKRLAALVFATLFAVSTNAQPPAAELATPPADARHFIILSTGGKHGDWWVWTLPDGTRRPEPQPAWRPGSTRAIMAPTAW